MRHGVQLRIYTHIRCIYIEYMLVMDLYVKYMLSWECHTLNIWDRVGSITEGGGLISIIYSFFVTMDKYCSLFFQTGGMLNPIHYFVHIEIFVVMGGDKLCDELAF